jgi:hypothetical protein
VPGVVECLVEYIEMNVSFVSYVLWVEQVTPG